MAEAEKPQKTHSMIELAVARKDGDPLMCPILTTTFLIGVQASPITKEVNGVSTSTTAVACVGAVCAVYDRERKCCGLLIPTEDQAELSETDAEQG